MGVVHKLKPEILKLILENKKNDPSLSCRILSQLIFDKFQVKISKSSINAIFKENNLSMPIGRRQKHKKKKFNMPALPVIEGTKPIALVEKPKELDLKVINEAVKKEIVEEQGIEEVDSEESRIKEAEEWAKKLLEEEKNKMEEKVGLEKQKVEDVSPAKENEERELDIFFEETAKIEAKKEDAKRLEEERAVQQAKLEKEKEELVKLFEETAKIEAQKEDVKRLEEERIIQEAKLEAEKENLGNFVNKEAKESEEDRLAQEEALKAERDRWARFAEEELKARQQVGKITPLESEPVVPKEQEPVVLKEESVVQKENEPNAFVKLSQDRVCSGVVLLKALDYLLGGSKEINSIICKELGVVPEEYQALTEAVIFRSLFANDNLSALWDLIGARYSQERLDAYYAQIQQSISIKTNISRILSGAFTEARGIKMHFIDGSIVYLDGQLHSIWSTQYIPYDFSNTVYELKNNLNKYFFQNQPLVLFSAPGYDVPSKDFFNLLLNIGSTSRYPDVLTLFGNKLEEVESILLNQKNKHALVFGIWPWQFTSSRKVKKIGNFDLKHIEGINQDLYLAEIEIDLLQASLNQTIALRGCAVKTNPTGKIRLVILSNVERQMSVDELANAYLNRWPNFEETFQDFSRKIELFAYVGNTQKFFSRDNFGTDMTKSSLELDKIFSNYIKMLDAYLRWYFLPTNYTEKDFSYVNECFYKLQAKLIANRDRINIKMQVGQNYQFLKDLEYLICRLNERQINLIDGASFYFESPFKIGDN